MSAEAYDAWEARQQPEPTRARRVRRSWLPLEANADAERAPQSRDDARRQFRSLIVRLGTVEAQRLLVELRQRAQRAAGV